MAHGLPLCRERKSLSFGSYPTVSFRQDVYAASNIKKKKWLIDLLNEHIGNKPITTLVPTDILGAIRPDRAAGHSVTTHKMAHSRRAALSFCPYLRLHRLQSGRRSQGSPETHPDQAFATMTALRLWAIYCAA